MEIPLAILADYANVADGGKLNIMGIFDRIWASTFPATHAQLYVVMKLVAEPAEYDTEKAVEIKLLNADGDEKLSLKTQMKIPRAEGGRPVEIPQILRLHNLKFEAEGDYVFVVLVNDDPKARIPITAARKEEEGG